MASPRPVPLYKLTDQKMQTHGGFQWKLGETNTASGAGGLCGPGWLHAYTDANVAVLLNPIQANIEHPRLFMARGVVGKTGRGTKVGCTSLRLLREIPVPKWRRDERTRFAIYCAWYIGGDKIPEWTEWALRWLAGVDRSYSDADAADAAADAAAHAAGVPWSENTLAILARRAKRDEAEYRRAAKAAGRKT